MRPVTLHAVALGDLGNDGAGDHVPRREVQERRRVALHEPLAPPVAQDPAFAAHGLGDEDSQAADPGGVELVELHVLEGNRRGGVVAVELATGEIHLFRAKAVLFATGGFGRMFRVTSNAYANTGDGPAVLARRGVPLQDMEFYQFHPTGIRGLGILITEAVRGEGGILRNRRGERFMERYAPTAYPI